MERREFIRRMGLSLAAGWAMGKLAWPLSAGALGPELRLALLADAHLKDGDDRRPEALALARAVAEIRSLLPPPDLVLFAGDLAHRGRPDALDLGREILSDLSSPVWAVPGEGDQSRHSVAAWVRRCGSPRFFRAHRGVNFLGVHTFLRPGAGGPVFEVGAAQRQWLASELAGLDPATPLVILSHAPLDRLFHPWQQWTGDAPEVSRLLAQFSQVLCLHGHVHGAGIWEPGIRDQGSGSGYFETNPSDYCRTSSLSLLTQNQEPRTQNHISLPATAWPRPLAVQGTPATLRPGLGPRGCGWALVTLNATRNQFLPQIWQA